MISLKIQRERIFSSLEDDKQAIIFPVPLSITGKIFRYLSNFALLLCVLFSIYLTVLLCSFAMLFGRQLLK